ncbi:MAG: hypothetical protein U0840_24850 [Gemmataceae bacterium]
MTRAPRLACLGLLVFLGGCGLSDYENRMMQAQLRHDRFEQEAKYLAGSVLLTAVEGKDGTRTNPPLLYFRPPRGISNSPENPTEPRAGLLYTFRPITAGAAGPFNAVEIAWALDNSNEFAEKVLRCFSATSAPAQRLRPIAVPGRDKVTFETTEFEDGQHFYSINRWKGDQEQIIIAYWVILAQKAQASKVIDISLESFAVMKDGAKLQALTRSPLEAPPSR